jgi:hypothetical protein
MTAAQRPLPRRPDRTFVASGAEVDPRWFAAVAWASLSARQRLVLVAGPLDWESYAAADPGGPSGGPLPLGVDVVACETLSDLPLLDRDISAGLVSDGEHGSWGYGPGEMGNEWPVGRGHEVTGPKGSWLDLHGVVRR